MGGEQGEEKAGWYLRKGSMDLVSAWLWGWRDKGQEESAKYSVPYGWKNVMVISTDGNGAL